MMLSIKTFDPNIIKIDVKPYKNTHIYYIFTTRILSHWICDNKILIRKLFYCHIFDFIKMLVYV